MKISRRTLIIAAIGLLVIVAAFFSLYLEKQAEITDLENIEPEDEPAKRTRVKKEVVPEPAHEPSAVIIDANESGNTTE